MRVVQRLPKQWRRMALALLLLGCAPYPARIAALTPVAEEDTTAVRHAAERFLRVFDNLDWEPFRASWAAQPSVFFPFDDTPERVTGRAAIEERFRRMFDEVRARTPGPPYLHLKPRDLRVEPYGDAALVTFMLGEPHGRVSRRTLLFVRKDGAWKLAHLHASSAGP